MLAVLMTMMYLGVIQRTPTRDGKNVIVTWKTVRFGNAKATGNSSILMFRWNLLYYPVKSKMSELEHTEST